jgi:ABC-type transport system involved in multi-copper enzyme maturation permease subunit
VKSVVWAIWVDTWRQSRHQVVYVLLACALLAVALGSVFLVKVQPNLEGQPVLTLRWTERPSAGLETRWDRQCRQALAGDRIEAQLRQPSENVSRTRAALGEAQRAMTRARTQTMSVEQQMQVAQRFSEARTHAQEASAEFDRMEKRLSAEAQTLVNERAAGLSALAKGVEVWSSGVTVVLLWIVMFGFISTAAGYFPGMMKAGAIDLVVAKPIHRFQLFIGKYLGGLGLCSAALLTSELVLIVGLGVSTGIWHWSVLAAFPLTLFSLGLLFAVVILIGISTRSTTLSMLGGYAYYVVVDTLLLGIQTLDASGVKIHWLEPVARISRYAFPAFSGLRNAAAAAVVVHIPDFDWQPVLVASVWLIALLAAAYSLFRRIDF